MKVLVVDDHATMRRIIRNQLTQIGYKDIDEAAGGEEALKKLRSAAYGLVISDWHMAPVTGYDLLRRVRAEAALKAVPFIMITAEAKTENFAAAKAAGVDNCLVKPFDAATLRQRIDAVVVKQASLS